MKGIIIINIEVKEVKDYFIIEEIKGIEYGYNAYLIDEKMVEVLRECLLGKEVKVYDKRLLHTRGKC
ncbi:hypothetical protein LCGC14_2074360 [marine sediment metagenome]|uniref:Uncharacterized protein n=1 Tax=marine sediment metagenome TaxID=412755 RepID=A0A0F9GVS1_9ZZZZ